MTLRSSKTFLPYLPAILATMFCAGSGMAATVPDHCIVGESVFGCRSERDIAQLTMYRGDPDALRQMIAVDLSSGVCQSFKEGERVFAIGGAGQERTAVRRSGDEASYWMPASWSRPVEECAAHPAPRSVAGNSGPTSVSANEPPTTRIAGPSVASQSAGSGCNIKPVMSDLEIATRVATWIVERTTSGRSSGWTATPTNTTLVDCDDRFGSIFVTFSQRLAPFRLPPPSPASGEGFLLSLSALSFPCEAGEGAEGGWGALCQVASVRYQSNCCSPLVVVIPAAESMLSLEWERVRSNGIRFRGDDGPIDSFGARY
jgi:hypothetical protein